MRGRARTWFVFVVLLIAHPVRPERDPEGARRSLAVQYVRLVLVRCHPMLQSHRCSRDDGGSGGDDDDDNGGVWHQASESSDGGHRQRRRGRRVINAADVMRGGSDGRQGPLQPPYGVERSRSGTEDAHTDLSVSVRSYGIRKLS